MNILKNVSTFLLAILLVSVTFVSCQKENNELTEEDIKTSLIEKVNAQKEKQLEAMNDPDSPLYRGPITGNSTCYNAGISVDKDCDSEYELGWNEETFSWGACWDRLVIMGIIATQNGWCWRLPDNNCQSYTCEGPGPLEGEPELPEPCDGC